MTHSGTATLSSANAGSYTITNLSGVSLADNAGLASNYTLTGGTHNFTVNPKVVSIQGNKTYDGNTTINTSDITAIVDTVGSETLVISSGTGTTSSPNTATYASAGINEGSLTLGDGTGLASNYTLTGHAVSSFQINQRVLSSLGSREYDGTSTVSSSDLTLSNRVGSEILTLSGNGTLADVNVAINKTVTLNTLSIADNTGLASNYTLTGGTHQLNITQRSVTLSGTRSYDGTNTVSNSDLTIGNLVGSETLTLTGAGTVASKDVGSNKSVTDLSFGLSDNTGLASNYMIGTKTFNITKQTITIDGSKIYDGNTTAAASDISTFNGLALSETLTINGSGTIATLQ